MSPEKKRKAPRALDTALFCVDRRRGHYVSVPIVSWERDLGVMCPGREPGTVVTAREHPLFVGTYLPDPSRSTVADLESWFRECARMSKDAPLKCWQLRFGRWTFAPLRPYVPAVTP